MNKHILFSFAFVFLCFYSNAQSPASTSTVDGSSYDVATNSALGFGLRHNVSLDDMDGSPYFIDDFHLGNALLANGILDDSLQLKYNLASKSFIAKLEDDSEIVINDRSVAEFRIFKDDDEFLFKRVDPKYPREFYEIIYQGNDLTLYKKENVKIIEGEELGIANTNHRISREARYYIRKGMEIQRIKLKKKFLWRFFDSEQQQLLNDYLEEHQIKLKKDYDYKRVLAILNS